MKNIIFYKLILFICVICGTYGNNENHNQTISTKNTTENLIKNVPVEGGTVKISDNLNLTKVETTTKTLIVKNVTHFGREGIKVESTTAGHPKNVTSTTEKVIPVSEASEIPIKTSSTSTTEKIEIIGDSKIKPRKGAPKYVFSNSTETSIKNSTTTTVKPKRMKPTVTIGSDDDVQSYRKIKNAKNASMISKEDSFFRNSKYKPDFVLPIVLTILAVPLIAIILTFGYKRCFEWYQHRHYRRMDFLIDGIYNN